MGYRQHIVELRKATQQSSTGRYVNGINPPSPSPVSELLSLSASSSAQSSIYWHHQQHQHAKVGVVDSRVVSNENYHEVQFKLRHNQGKPYQFKYHQGRKYRSKYYQGRHHSNLRLAGMLVTIILLQHNQFHWNKAECNVEHLPSARLPSSVSIDLLSRKAVLI